MPKIVRLTKEEKESIKTMYQNGCTISEISKELGRTYASTYSIIKKMSIGKKYDYSNGETWTKCKLTCPDYCPYKDCILPSTLALKLEPIHDHGENDTPEAFEKRFLGFNSNFEPMFRPKSKSGKKYIKRAKIDFLKGED